MQYRTNTHNHTHTPLLLNAFQYASLVLYRCLENLKNQNGEDCEKEEDYDTDINPFMAKFPG